MRSRSRNILALVAALMVLTLVAVPVLASSTSWKLYSFNTSGRSLRSQSAPFSGGSASFTFPKTADAAYLLSTATPNLVGGLHATVGITATADATFAYYPNNTPAMVGLYFETKAAGAFNPSDYWWSGSSRVTLDSLVTTPTPTSMSTSLDPANWTNFYGKPGTLATSYIENGVTYPAPSIGFNAAIAHISSWGVSFGGGSFFANGVGTPTGSAVFTLTP